MPYATHTTVDGPFALYEAVHAHVLQSTGGRVDGLLVHLALVVTDHLPLNLRLARLPPAQHLAAIVTDRLLWLAPLQDLAEKGHQVLVLGRHSLRRSKPDHSGQL